jgi:hypothetical protein
MTTAILKYPLRNSPGVNQNIVIKGALVKVLTVQMQGDIPTLWALVHTDPDIPDYSQSIYIITLGTGWEDDFDRYEYISTVQDKEGFVWHYFIGNYRFKGSQP